MRFDPKNLENLSHDFPMVGVRKCQDLLTSRFWMPRKDNKLQLTLTLDILNPDPLLLRFT